MSWRESEKLKTCAYGVFRVWSSPQLMAKLYCLGYRGNHPPAWGRTSNLGHSKSGQGAGKQDAPDDPGVRQVKRGAPATVTTPAGFPISVETPKEPCWSKLFTIGMPKWS